MCGLYGAAERRYGEQMGVQPSKKMSGDGLFRGVCPVAGCYRTTRTGTRSMVIAALTQHMVQVHGFNPGDAAEEAAIAEMIGGKDDLSWTREEQPRP